MKNLLSNLITKQNVVPSILFAGLFILTFVFWPSASVTHEVPKVWFFKRFVEILFLAALCTGSKQHKMLNKTILLTTLGFILFVSFISLFGVDPRKSIVGNYYRWDGLITYYYLFTFSLFIAYFVKKSWVEGAVISISLSSLITSILVIGAFLTNSIFGISTPWENNADGMFFGNPNFMAGFLLVTLPFVYYSAKVFFGRRSVLVVIVQIFALVLTFSKTAILGLPLFMLFELTFISKFRLNKQLISISGIALVVLSVIFYLDWKSNIDPYSFTAESRQRIYTKALIATSQRPLTGWGWANFDYAFSSIDWPIVVAQDVYVDKAHSAFLEVITTTGVIGGCLYLWILLLVTIAIYEAPASLRLGYPFGQSTQGRRLLPSFRREQNSSEAENSSRSPGLHPQFSAKGDKGKQKYSRALLVTLLLYMIHSQTNVISISEEVIFWLILGVALRQKVSSEKFKS